MPNICNTVLAVLMAGISLGSLAQSAATNDPHHLDGTPVTSTASKPAPSPKAMGPAQMADMEQHMKAMRGMTGDIGAHHKMMDRESAAMPMAK